jgi:hypothetical protein
MASKPSPAALIHSSELRMATSSGTVNAPKPAAKARLT